MGFTAGDLPLPCHPSYAASTSCRFGTFTLRIHGTSRHHPTDMRLKKRIARTLIEEILVDLSPERFEIQLVIHWKGGVHTELRVPRRRRGQHFQATSEDTVDAIRVLARVGTDDRIAQALNRSGLKTGQGEREHAL